MIIFSSLKIKKVWISFQFESTQLSCENKENENSQQAIQSSHFYLNYDWEIEMTGQGLVLICPRDHVCIHWAWNRSPTLARRVFK